MIVIESLTERDHVNLIRFIIDCQKRPHCMFHKSHLEVKSEDLKKSLQKLQIALHVSWGELNKK